MSPGPSRHSVHVDHWPSAGPDVAPAECAHGYGSGCPDCDVPSYLPAVLDGPDVGDREPVRTWINGAGTVGITADADGLWIATRAHTADVWGPPELLRPA